MGKNCAWAEIEGEVGISQIGESHHQLYKWRQRNGSMEVSDVKKTERARGREFAQQTDECRP